MVPLLGIGGPDVASKREAQSGNLDGFFQCSQCKASKPLRERIMKGCQAWCITDNNSYNALRLSRQRNAKLNAWWQGVPVDDNKTWFLTWQSCSAKRRFEDLTFEDKSSSGQ